MRRHILISFFMLFAAVSLTVPAYAAYTSVQIRVQINTATAWSTNINAAMGNTVHIGVFKNDWGVPIDEGGVSVYAVQGSSWQYIPLSGWDANWKPSVALENDTWTFHVYYGSMHDQATVTWGGQIDVLSYVLPNYPSSLAGSTTTIRTNKSNLWRTYSSSNGSVGERLPGFYITKGGIDWNWLANEPGTCPSNYQDIMWYFEEMIYDSQWIYLVRDTSWTSTCDEPNGHIVGQLLFTYENGQWLRGGRHFPRYVANGGTRNTGDKYVQGVERKLNTDDVTVQEGRWCSALYSGTTSSTVKGELIGTVSLGDRTFHDVLKLSIVGGSGEADQWWFAKGYGFIYFADANQSERYSYLESSKVVYVRIPCYPSAPCM